MNSDSYFRIGYSHDVCEDFAISGKSYAILSDGCSGSKFTDFGSRFMALSTAKVLDCLESIDSEIYKSALPLAKFMANAAGISETCLDATIGYVFANNTHFQAFLAGDGAIAALKKDGNTWSAIFSYPMGAPPYLSYLLDENRTKLFMEKTHGCQCIIDMSITDNGGRLPVYKHGMEPHYFEFSREEYDMVLIMSDGISSFQRPKNSDTTKAFEEINPHIIIQELLAVKSPTGNFIKRRCKRIIKDLCIKQGWRHLDDFSIAAIHS